ncbi:cysteine-rich outer membrane protein [Flavobacterium sp. N1994]|uniref:cysteine-rich outer membrane protein n=1 Tax=Flavobacterium sp. N1994 TaxID=2986827 RepID=UPI0039B6D1A2
MPGVKVYDFNKLSLVVLGAVLVVVSLINIFVLAANSSVIALRVIVPSVLEPVDV